MARVYASENCWPKSYLKTAICYSLICTPSWILSETICCTYSTFFSSSANPLLSLASFSKLFFKPLASSKSTYRVVTFSFCSCNWPCSSSIFSNSLWRLSFSSPRHSNFCSSSLIFSLNSILVYLRAISSSSLSSRILSLSAASYSSLSTLCRRY